MSLDRLWVSSARARLWRWVLDEIVHAPIEPILHLSNNRLLLIAAFTFIGHVVIAWTWGAWLVQPYENYVVRAIMAGLAVLYLLPVLNKESGSEHSGLLFGIATWIQLPWFFTWMYWMNGGNAVWLGSIATMVLIYFHATDWRIASLGLLSGGIAGWLTAQLLGGGTPFIGDPASNAVVIAFACILGLMLGFSSANLRRIRLINTLSTMAVMAHELRTPLATVDLLGDVLRNQAQHDLPDGKRKKLEDLASRLQGLVRSMNRQIDTQISNAQLLRLPREQSAIQVAELIHDVVAQYPYRSSRERDCIQVQIQEDFCFIGSRALFAQMLSNLIKNALHSLAATSSAPVPGDLRITAGVYHGKGRIAVADQGLGIAYEYQQRIFEPFFSTQTGAGSGLGLTFCKNVVETAQGKISVHSEPAQGAVFVIDLPLHEMTTA